MSVAIATVTVTFPMFQSTSSSELRAQSSLGGRRRETRINKAMVASPAFRGQWKRERELTTMTQAMDSSSRPLAGFQPTVWGYHFLSDTFQQTEISSQEKHEVEELKERIRKMLVETPDNSTQKHVLIDAIQRLGVAYHFHNEIQISIQNISDTTSSQVLQQSESDDNVLYVVALRFRLLRQQGHHMSSDVFKQFIDHDGNFKETLINDDVQGLLSLYEATHMRMHKEEILEEALNLTTSRLESMVPYLSNSLKIQVTEALSRPIRRTLSRVGARKYISIYENGEARNDLLLKFAKLDFNMLQKLHQQELVELTSWWKDLDVPNKIPYTKDRLVEGHFWIIGMCFEPQYSRVRRMLTKLLCLNSIIDDMYDAYGTFDELVLFTNVIQRWDISVVDSLPPYMRIIYQELLNFYSEGEQLLSNEGNSNSVAVSYSKNEMKKLVIAYMKETEWMNAGYIPKCEEYMTIALATSTCMLHVTHSLIGMEEPVTKETIEWMENRSLAIRAATIICRLMDDISDHEGQLERKHVASIIDCYIKEYEASKEEAYVEYRKEVTNAWKDINKEFLSPIKLPMFILERALNFARLSDTFFEGGQDGYAIYPKSKTIDLITLLFVESIKI